MLTTGLLILGAVGAAISLAAGLRSAFLAKVEHEKVARQSHDIRMAMAELQVSLDAKWDVTVKDADGTLEKHGSIRSDKVPALLEMLDDTEPSSYARAHAAR